MILTVFAPFCAGLILCLFRSKISLTWSYLISIIGTAISFVTSIILLLNPINSSIVTTMGKFLLIHSKNALGEQFFVDWILTADIFSIVMLLTISFVALIVQIYSIGYMHSDTYRFTAYISFFTSFMLLVVVANEPLVMLIGWEGVGLCSYLLVGYWQDKAGTDLASYKVFIVNRIGDIGFLLATMLYYSAGISQHTSIAVFGVPCDIAKVLPWLFLLPAFAKSAQILFHVWLPDAMHAPTPVSALLHAATMVAAGVILAIKVSYMFHISHSMVVTIVGAITALFASTCAVAQYDLKKIIAYSTCSQLGFMFVAIGSTGANVAAFHLISHAIFKSLLFLCAGAFIFASHHEQDIRKMSGIGRSMPYLFYIFLIGILSLTGVPPFSGYYSKDMIIELLYSVTHEQSSFIPIWVLWMILFATFLTAVYSFRLLLILYGERRYSLNIQKIPETMMIPMYVLALISAVFGFLAKDFFLKDMCQMLMLGQYNLYSIGTAFHAPNLLSRMLLLLPVLGGITAWFIVRIKDTSIVMHAFSRLRSFCYNAWFFDSLYNVIFVRRALSMSQLCNYIEVNVIQDGILQLVSIYRYIGHRISTIRSGYIYYNIWIVWIGLILAILLSIVFNYTVIIGS